MHPPFLKGGWSIKPEFQTKLLWVGVQLPFMISLEKPILILKLCRVPNPKKLPKDALADNVKVIKLY